MRLDQEFYSRSNVVKVAKDLLGKCLFTKVNGEIAGGIIVETEAYSSRERGSHAYQNRRTPRNEVMFGKGGHAYVYLCYGIHQMFNVVTNEENKADAVLVRALEPIEGLDLMMERMNTKNQKRVTSGPGKLTKSLGIDRTFNGDQLWSRHLWLEDIGQRVGQAKIVTSARIGIDYAGEDAFLPWRFALKDNIWVSK